MDYYNLETNYPETLFDVIIFGSSFMIMPDQTKAIEIAKSIVVFTQDVFPKTAESTSC